jgi:ribosomal protein S27E
VRPVADVQCPNCRHASGVEYRLLGSTVLCPGCGECSIPAVPVGGVYPVTAWELTFADFQQLLSPASRGQIAPLLRSWFGYTLAEAGSALMITGPAGDTVDALTVHLRIQDDVGKQLALYQLAMSLWR